MATRTYNDLCGIARALDVVGERWAVLVVRELMLGPKRFTDLRAGLRSIGPDMLAARLRDLEAAGVVAHRALGPPAGSQVYELTDRGRELEPVLLALGRWGSVEPPRSPSAKLGVDSAVLALPSLFDAEAAGDLEASYGLRLDDQDFEVRVSGGTIGTDRGEAASPVATLATDPGTFAGLLWQDLDLSAAEQAGAVTVEGNRRAAKSFLRLFPLPG
jgi:DNA-binding HxlR family transcriptional regulator